jgi:bacterioferritin (cytochrome b1)
MIGDDVREVLDADLRAEYRVRAHSREARDVAVGAGVPLRATDTGAG